jgi:hypothetical protein
MRRMPARIIEDRGRRNQGARDLYKSSPITLLALLSLMGSRICKTSGYMPESKMQIAVLEQTTTG